jgi:superfamily I DNA/RNA helicase
MTFHALGYRILREHAARLNLPPNFRVAAENDLVAALKTELKLTAPQARQWLARLAARKRGGAEAAKEAPDPSAQCELRAAYERILRARGWVDFDDLIRLPLELLETHEELAELYRQRYRWISIDEYQDVDERQYRLLKRLAPPDGNLCAIGDPDQAIYGFRGGDVRFFGRFTADFPAARVAHLIRNYRSGRAIVGAALQVIAPASLAPGRALQALSLDTTRIAIHAAPTDKAEAEFVVHTIEQLISGTTFFSLDSERATAGEGEALGFSDIAVLYRMDAQAEPLVTALARSGLPYQKRAHGPLREHPAVCTLVDAMHDKTAGDDAVGRSLDAALAGLGDEYRREALALAPVLEPLAARCGSLDEFLSELALMSDADLWDPRADAISLLTLHSAKGLEFPVVFIVGCEDGLLPLRWQGAEDIDPDEERRLFFVGITRAKRRLLLAWAQRRLWLGQMRERQPSPFLRAIEEELLEARRGAGRRRRRAAGEQLDLLPTVGGIEP